MKEVADIIAADSTGEWEMGKYTGPSNVADARRDCTTRLQLYESRGRQDRHHIEDWLRAEQELWRHYA